MSAKVLKNKPQNRPRLICKTAIHDIAVLKNEAFSGNQYAIERLVDIAEECSRAIEWLWEGHNFPIGVDHIKQREFNRSKIKTISMTRSDWPILYHSLPKERKMAAGIIKQLELEKDKLVIQRASSDEYGILLLNMLLAIVGTWKGKDLKEYSKKAAVKIINEYSDPLYNEKTWLGSMLSNELDVIDKRNYTRTDMGREQRLKKATFVEEININTKQKDSRDAFGKYTVTNANTQKVLADIILRKLIVNESKAAKLH